VDIHSYNRFIHLFNIIPIVINLHIDSITKSFNNEPLLSDVFLNCELGEIIGVLGRNGCGKSTLLKIIYGVESSSSRFVRVGDKVIRGVSDTKNLLSFLPQNGYLPYGVRIKTLINFFLPKENRDIICENEFMKPFLDRKINNLSGGEKRIVEVLMMVHSPSKFLLLDEPFTGISPIVKEELNKILLNSKKSKGIIITDHDYESILNIVDKVVLLKNGNTKHIKNNEELVRYGYLSKERYDLIFSNL